LLGLRGLAQEERKAGGSPKLRETARRALPRGCTPVTEDVRLITRRHKPRGLLAPREVRSAHLPNKCEVRGPCVQMPTNCDSERPPWVPGQCQGIASAPDIPPPFSARGERRASPGCAQ
jgi:hypothetical protein